VGSGGVTNAHVVRKGKQAKRVRESECDRSRYETGRFPESD